MSQTSSPAVLSQECSFLLCNNGLIHLPQPLKIVALVMNQDFNPSLQQSLAVHEDTEGESLQFSPGYGFHLQLWGALFRFVFRPMFQGSKKQTPKKVI